MAEIRLMQDGDALAVSDIYEESWKSAYRGIIPDAYLDGIPKGRWADNLKSPNLHSLVLLKNGKMIGTSAYCASRMERMKGYGEIVSIYLLPAYFHQGYGRQLLTAALFALKESGYEKAFLWVLEENIAARRFYEKFGFQKTDAVLEDQIGGRDLREVQYIYHMKDLGKTILQNNILRLEQAAVRHKEAAEAMKREFYQNKEQIINGSALLDRMPFDEWLARTDQNYNPETVCDDWAEATTFFAVRQSDGKMLGMIDVRHELTVPFLKEYGGHIGYAVRPSERKKGYAVNMLKLALSYCKTLGIPSVMLGCYIENEASIRTIERCGGIRTEEKPYTDGKPMAIYRIDC